MLLRNVLGGATEIRTQKPAFTDRWISNPLQYHYGTAPLKYLAGRTCTTKFGGPYRGRTGDYALQGHCVPNYTNSPNSLATREGIEPPLMVLETIALPLYYPAMLDTLLPVCVSKHSKLLRLPVRRECLDTPEFYH